MKKLVLPALLLFSLCGSGFAQSITGKWSGAFPGQDGQLVAFTMTITDKAYMLDFGSDGQVDITGGYIDNGGQVTIWDTAGENICPSDKKGVYQYSFDKAADTLTFTKVSDDCPERGGEPMVLKRM